MGILERYEAKAAAWEQGKRAPELLVQAEREMMVMFFWCSSEGRHNEKNEITDSLIAFVNASMRAYDDRPQQRGLGNFMNERDYCERCASKWMRNNLYFCTKCLGYYCFDCCRDFPKAKNGNRRDSCGGELVMGFI